MILKNKAHIFSLLTDFVKYMPDAAETRSFQNNELLAKLFFQQVTGYSYEEVITAYHTYPSMIATFQAECLVNHRVSIDVEEPKLTSTIKRDANGDICHAFVKLRFTIQATAIKGRGRKKRLYVDLDLYTSGETEDCSGLEYPTVQLVMHSLDPNTLNQRPTYPSEDLVKRPPIHYARCLRSAIYTVVRDYVEHERPEIFNGKPRADD